MSNDPFIYMYLHPTTRRQVNVPPGYEGFVLHDGGRSHLPPGAHRLDCTSEAAVFLVHVNGAHRLEVPSLGGAMLRCLDGSWRPIQLFGRFVYSITRAELLVDLLQREKIYEMRAFERELGSMVVDVLSNVFDGEPLDAKNLSENLEYVSGELLPRLDLAGRTCGVGFLGVDLIAEPMPASPSFQTSSS